jgi:hypothetical protein
MMPRSLRLNRFTYALPVVIILAAFLVAGYHLQRESLWADEAWTAWAVRSPYIRDVIGRVQGDVHPPLYFLLLAGWARLAGDSALALRLFSALAGAAGLAATYALGTRLFDRRAGLIAMLILGSSSFFVYYSREARMYVPLLALAALATYAYLRWLDRPGRRNTLAYALLLAALLYTHYAGLLVLVTHALHGILTALWNWPPRFRRRRLIPYGLAAALFAPWLPVFVAQLRDNPNGPLALPVITDWAAVGTLLAILTSGYWLLFLLSFILGRALLQLRTFGRGVLLVMLWLVITPLALLALNAWVTPVYQVRYVIAILPAGALLAAYGLRWAGVGERRFITWLAFVGLLGGIVYTQLNQYGTFWADKPAWEQTLADVVETRLPLEPAITDFAPYSPAAYYDRLLDVRRGIALDLSWRLHIAEEAWEKVAVLDNEPRVWALLPINTAKSWHILAALDAGRGAGYRASLVNMVFYRFDRDTPGDLRFRFGDTLRYVSGPGAGQQLAVRPGAELCVNLELAALQPLGDQYSYGLHLVNLEGDAAGAGIDSGLGIHEAGDTIFLAPCLSIPPETPPGAYHLELVVYKWATVQRLMLLEDGGGDPLAWGDALMLAAVRVNDG